MSPSIDDPADGLSVATVTMPHGLRGAVVIRLHDDEMAEVFRGLRSVMLRQPGGPFVGAFDLRRVSALPKPGRLQAALAGVNDRDAAERLRGLEVWVARSDLPALTPEEYYLADLVGCFVVPSTPDDGHANEGDVNDGVSSLGRIVGFTSNGAQDLAEVESRLIAGGKVTWLLPAFAPFVRDVKRPFVFVDLPEGLAPEGLAREPVSPRPPSV